MKQYRDAELSYSIWDLGSAQTFNLLVDGFEKRVSAIQEAQEPDSGINFINEPNPEPEGEEEDKKEEEDDDDQGFDFGGGMVSSGWKISN